MRKLVTIRKIDKLLPIPKKDRISVAQIGGWNVIVKKSEFVEGDLCAFFEIDSFLPQRPEFEFLNKTTTYQGKTGYRIKTMKMSGIISQGLALPLHMFPELTTSIEVGTDVTDLLGVIKYDNQVAQYEKKPGLRPGKAKGKFPPFLPKTEQERIQNLSHYFELYKDTHFEVTLKLDGSSMTCYKIERSPTLLERFKSLFGFKVKPYHFGVCSRNLEITPSDDYSTTFQNGSKTSVYDQSDFWKASSKYHIEQLLPCGYALQGELVGPRIQSNHEKVEELEFYVFDIYNIKEQRYLTWEERHYMMLVDLPSVPHVPVVAFSTPVFSEHTIIEHLLTSVEGESMNPGTVSEGQVFKSHDGQITFKAISNQYLLKSER